MARSSYIYLLREEDTDYIVGAFTVKHEMETYRDKYAPRPTYWQRFRDNGGPGFIFGDEHRRESA